MDEEAETESEEFVSFVRERNNSCQTESSGGK